eukprot:m.8621 g.8621  ORF g.8621 m.8621 type:complete len:422 (-) comp9228_c0_seq1:43-1308(-)
MESYSASYLGNSLNPSSIPEWANMAERELAEKQHSCNQHVEACTTAEQYQTIALPHHDSSGGAPIQSKMYATPFVCAGEGTWTDENGNQHTTPVSDRVLPVIRAICERDNLGSNPVKKYYLDMSRQSDIDSAAKAKAKKGNLPPPPPHDCSDLFNATDAGLTFILEGIVHYLADWTIELKVDYLNKKESIPSTKHAAITRKAGQQSNKTKLAVSTRANAFDALPTSTTSASVDMSFAANLLQTPMQSMPVLPRDTIATSGPYIATNSGSDALSPITSNDSVRPVHSLGHDLDVRRAYSVQHGQKIPITLGPSPLSSLVSSLPTRGEPVAKRNKPLQPLTSLLIPAVTVTPNHPPSSVQRASTTDFFTDLDYIRLLEAAPSSDPSLGIFQSPSAGPTLTLSGDESVDATQPDFSDILSSYLR